MLQGRLQGLVRVVIAEFWAPTRGREKPVLQHRDAHGERWLAIQLHTPVLYEDLAGLYAPDCMPEIVPGFVARVELLLTSPEPRLIIYLQKRPPDELALAEAAERKSTP